MWSELFPATSASLGLEESVIFEKVFFYVAWATLNMSKAHRRRREAHTDARHLDCAKKDKKALKRPNVRVCASVWSSSFHRLCQIFFSSILNAFLLTFLTVFCTQTAGIIPLWLWKTWASYGLGYITALPERRGGMPEIFGPDSKLPRNSTPRGD